MMGEKGEKQKGWKSEKVKKMANAVQRWKGEKVKGWKGEKMANAVQKKNGENTLIYNAFGLTPLPKC